MNYTKTFRDRISDLEITYQQQGKTQKDLAKSLGVSARTIRRWKNGVTKPRGKERTKRLKEKVYRREYYYRKEKPQKVGRKITLPEDRNIIGFDAQRALTEDYSKAEERQLLDWIRANETIIVPTEVYLAATDELLIFALIVYTASVHTLKDFGKRLDSKTRMLMLWLYGREYSDQLPVIEYGDMHLERDDAQTYEAYI